MAEEKSTLIVRVDKSHILTLGEKLYAESIELVRELVNNAYDADATEVKVTVTDDYLRVEDNGTGMDLKGLEEYFNIGTLDKRIHPQSPKFNRSRIGQFGIGKFATLSACQSFEVFTQTKDFSAKVKFDKAEWQKVEESWKLPLEILKPDPKRGEGTTVTLSKLTKKFDLEAVERCIKESVPLSAPHFTVYLNGRRIMPHHLSGHKIPFFEGTDYGYVQGEIVIVPAAQASTDDLGIQCKVKGVTIKRELLGMESWGKIVARIKGEVNADFLPITSDRNDFLRDSSEYQAFLEVMNRVMEEVRLVVGRLTSQKETKRVKQALRDALQKVQRALALNPDLSPFGAVPLDDGIMGVGGVVALPSPEKEAVREIKFPEKKVRKRARKRVPTVRRLTPDAVVQKVRIGNVGITCCLDHFGLDGPECFTEETVIYITRDHPLYRRQIRKKDSHIMHIARLLTQEISLMKDPKNPRQAFERQSKLLRDAFAGDK